MILVVVMACGSEGGKADQGIWVPDPRDGLDEASGGFDWGGRDPGLPDAPLSDLSLPDVPAPDAGPDLPPLACEDEGDCPTALPWCDAVRKRCVACLFDAQCGPDRVCKAGTCVDAPCTANEKKCVADTLKTCNAVGTGWSSHSCAPMMCASGACVGCEPGSTACEGNDLTVCVQAGTHYSYDHTCEGVCYEGACHACTPGKQACEGHTVVECDASGEVTVPVEDCQPDETGRVCQSGKCVSLCLDNLKLNTNVGCDYWAVDLDQVDEKDADDIQFSVVVSNTHPTIAARITITNHDGSVTQEGPVPARELKVFNLPPQNVQGTVKDLLAWHVQSTIPIVAYQFNPLENLGVFSNDASMLIPSNSLGKRYRVLTWSERRNKLRAYLAVVGVGPGTTSVSVTTTVKTLGGAGVPAMNPGEEQTFELQPFEVLNIETDQTLGELTGSAVEASQPVAVFAGTMCSNVPDSTICENGKCLFQPGWNCQGPQDCPVTCCCDHLEEQLPPLQAWGWRFVAPKSFDRGNERDVFRILASKPNTQVVVTPAVVQVPVLQALEFFEFQSGDHLRIEASEPVLVGQFLASENAPNPDNDTCDKSGVIGLCKKEFKPCNANVDCGNIKMPGDANIGDPALTFLSPEEQFRSEYLFLVPDKYAKDYVSIVAPLAAVVTLDDQPLDVGTAEPAGGVGWVVYRTLLPDGVHHVIVDKPVGVYVYGYDSYVSYGYPAGANVVVINPDGI